MAKHPLAEVFGFPADNYSKLAERHRRDTLCPFNNKVPSCTKDKAKDPLGVCSIVHEGEAVITCPIRFRENWTVASDSAAFFFPPEAKWTSLTEVTLKDRKDTEAGNIDLVLVSYDRHGKVVDFGTVEVQAVYISGNIRLAFEYYMKNRGPNFTMDWSGHENYPRPDYLSSSRKRLAPQLIYKGGILKKWGKKQAVAVQRPFFETLPRIPQVPEKQAEMVWLVYDLVYDRPSNRYALQLTKRAYTKFKASLDRITKPTAGRIEDFVSLLQEKLHEKLDGNPPDTHTITDMGDY